MSEIEKKNGSNGRSHAFRDELVSIAKDDVVGVGEFKQSKLMYLTGLSAFKSTLQGVKKLGKAGYDGIKLTAKFVFHRTTVEESERLPSDVTDEAERFKLAQHQYGKSDKDVHNSQDMTHRGFMLYFMLLGISLAVGILTFRFYPLSFSAFGSVGMFLDVLSRFMLTPVLFALTCRQAFYNWQFRTMRLGSFGQWVKTPSAWWTEPYTRAGGGGSGSGVVAAFLLIVTTAALASFPAGTAMADDASTSDIIQKAFSNPETTDLWWKLLELVFPGVPPFSGSLSAASVTPISNGIAGGFAALLTVLMSVASVAMTYQLFVGMISTAHEGKVLGERWHQIWAPVRVVAGVGMLAPVIKGYCAAQLIVLQVAVWGGNIGNMVWAGVVDNLSVAQVQNQNLRETMPFVVNLAKAEVCYAALEVFQGTSDAVTGASVPTSSYRYVDPYNASPGYKINRDLMSYLNTGWEITKDFLEVGNVLSNNERQAKDASLYGGVVQELKWDYGVCGSMTGSFAMGETSGADAQLAFDTARLAAITSLRAELRKLAIQFAKNMTAGQEAVSVDSLVATTNAAFDAKTVFDNALLTAAEAYLAKVNSVTMSEFQTAAKSAGWISAGPYYVALSRINSQVFEVLGDMPEFEEGNTVKIDNTDAAKLLFDETTGVMPKFRAVWDKEVSSTLALDQQAARAGQVEPDVVSFYTVLGKPGQYLMMALVSLAEIEPGNGSAMQQMVGFGHLILNLFYMVIAVWFAAKLFPAGKLAGAAATVGSKIAGALGGQMPASLMMFLMMFCVGLLAVGVIHAFVLPMIPFIQFFFFVTGMLILVVEGVIAAPLWAFFHIRMDGQDYVDQVQRPGYMILFNLFLRIPLAVLGLLFSILVFEALIWLIYVTFYPAVLAATSANVSGLVGGFVMAVILTYMHYQIAMRSFQLINQVPDRVSRWFGQNGENLGEDNDAKQSTAFVVGEIRSGTSSMAGKGGLAAGINQGRGNRQGDNGKPPVGSEGGDPPEPPTTGTNGGEPPSTGSLPTGIKGT
ncbi:DotA/TraY family protein [Thalassospira xianhensis]|uniref:Uncharacterized protein n=1 Tax=Thalassospira xianhensis MCCC 1A02616 TaxID=1177929 RepID=A0A367UDH1_9PROT|nr:DotA/TraY family protein [Thalassospira xianhensis]RCK06365.1 hypothetical protein TH5_09205 [Thalassospira xianhensis MCCC 1A02616]